MKHAISGVSFFQRVKRLQSGNGNSAKYFEGRKTLDCKLTTVVKIYSPGLLGLELNADTPVIPTCVYSIQLSL